jgi:hypothetical protein
MIRSLNELLGFFLEIGMLAAFAYAGFHWGNNGIVHYLSGIGVPLLLIIYWAKYMAPKAPGRLLFPWLQIVSLLLFEASAMTLYFSGVVRLAVVFAIASFIHAVLRFILKTPRA